MGSVKAFDCIPVIETAQLMVDGRLQAKVECIECCSNELFVGSSEGGITVYNLEEKVASDGKIIYNNKKRREHHLNVKKPIKCMKAASALNRLLVLCNTGLYVLDMESLESIGGSPQLQGITTFCVNENPNVDDPFCTQICVAEKKKLKIINVTDKRFNLVSDISIPEHARDVAVDGPFVCVALLKQYKIYNFETKASQDLFDIPSENFLPVIRRVTKDEFLLTASEGLGMFVTSQGVISRPPLQWSCQFSQDSFNNPGILSLAYFHPYVLGISNDVVMVHSILDQKQKQVLQFNGGLTIGNFDGRIYLNSHSCIYSLFPVPWEKQVKALLADKRVDEALELTENANLSGSTKDQYEKMYQTVHKQAAFIYFSSEEFEKAKDLLIKSQIDIREVISLFPKMLPRSSNFMRAVPPLHDIADVDQLFHKNEDKLMQAHMFLRHLLEELHDTSPHLAHQYEVDTALIKLYSQSNRADLEAFIVAGEIHCDVEDCLEWLENHECYHALALIHRHSRNHELALQIWCKILKGELQDDSFQGLQFFVECLANLKDLDLVWQYADFVLQKDQCLGVQIFTKRSNAKDFSDHDKIVEYVQKYPLALAGYLEYLVVDLKIMKEKYHTHLALLYLERLIKMKKDNVDGTDFEETRNKFHKFLQDSNLYRSQLLLGKIKGSGLHREAATLYGKVDEHDKALDILVHRLKDYQAAEDYCINNSRGKDKKSRSRLFKSLLGCYLNPKLEHERKEELIGPALDLLNRQAIVFDSAEVLEMLPSEWSLTVVGSFLRGALRASLHQYRMSKVESALARGENLQRKFTLYDLQHNSVLLQESNYCCICKKPFIDGSFARYPNNVITHVACAKQNDVCPLTGKVFRSAYPGR